MTTLMQIFAVAVAGVTVGALIAAGIGADRSGVQGSAREFHKRIAAWLRPHAGGLGIAVAVLAAFTFWTQSWSFWVGRSTERKAFGGMSAQAAAYHEGADKKSNLPFLEFVRARLAPGETYAIVPKKALADDFAKQWGSYVLTPSLLVDEKEADVLVILGADPSKIEYDRKRFPRLERFEPDFAIARPAP